MNALNLLKVFPKKAKLDKGAEDIDFSKITFPLKPEKYPDPRDWAYTKTVGGLIPLPELVDLRPKFSDIKNQQSLNSCQSFAVSAVLEYLWLQKKQTIFDFSERYLYWQIRAFNHQEHLNVGAYIVDAVKTPIRDGYCFEENFPYSLDFDEAPGWYPNLVARILQIFIPKGGYYKMGAFQSGLSGFYDLLSDIKSALYEGYPIMFGIHVYENFMAPDATGIISEPSGEYLGGHAMVIVGYDDRKQSFIVRNSFGKNWGDKGYCYIPYTQMAYVFDLFVYK